MLGCPSWFLSCLDLFFPTTTISNSFFLPSKLCLELKMEMCFNEPLVFLDVFQAKSTQFTQQAI